MIENKLDGWVFYYSSHDEKWACCPREHLNEAMNNYSCPSIIRSSSKDTLIELVMKTDGDIEKMASLCID